MGFGNVYGLFRNFGINSGFISTTDFDHFRSFYSCLHVGRCGAMTSTSVSRVVGGRTISEGSRSQMPTDSGLDEGISE